MTLLEPERVEFITNAPQRADGFSTVALGVVEDDHRRVSILPCDVAWQVERYASGLCFCLTPDEYARLKHLITRITHRKE
jgi:hypothetical protein